MIFIYYLHVNISKVYKVFIALIFLLVNRLCI